MKNRSKRSHRLQLALAKPELLPGQGWRRMALIFGAGASLVSAGDGFWVMG